MAGLLALPTVAPTAEPRAGCSVGLWAAETVGSWADWTAAWSVALKAPMRAAKMVVQTAESRADSKVEKTAACWVLRWADYLAAYWAGSMVDSMATK